MDISELVKLKSKIISRNSIIAYKEILDLCKRPYPGHRKGCPNIEKCHNELIVPFFKKLDSQMKFRFYYLLYAIFDFKGYKKSRKKEYPKWSDGKIKCVLYWQGSVKSLIRKKLEKIYNEYDFYVLGCGSGLKLSFQKPVASMEAVGINVFSTMKINKVEFEIKPISRIVFCNLLCSKKPIHINI